MSNAMTENISSQQKGPWYKQPWLWFVLSVPIASVILSSIMVTVAVVGKDSLVSDNYYKDGMGINQTIEQDRLAKELGLQPSLTIQQDGIVSLTFNSANLPPQAFVTVKILHPTMADKDQIVRLLPTGNALMGEIAQGLSGRYYIDVYAYDESWRIREEVHLPVQDYILNQQ